MDHLSFLLGKLGLNHPWMGIHASMGRTATIIYYSEDWTGKVLQLQFIQSCHTYVQLTEFWPVFVLGPKHSGVLCSQLVALHVVRWLSVSLGGRFVLCISFSFWNVQHLILSRNLSSDLATWIGSGARCSKTRSIRSTVCSAVADEFNGTRFKCSN